MCCSQNIASRHSNISSTNRVSLGVELCQANKWKTRGCIQKNVLQWHKITFNEHLLKVRQMSPMKPTFLSLSLLMSSGWRWQLTPHTHTSQHHDDVWRSVLCLLAESRLDFIQQEAGVWIHSNCEYLSLTNSSREPNQTHSSKLTLFTFLMRASGFIVNDSLVHAFGAKLKNIMLKTTKLNHYSLN